ncbi:MAG TPA: TIGR02302 family protein [Xanthobacteraceae bacterium]|nr:TIGR02302 family protein [Xanthobacteraceae bacterium]
MPAPDDEPNVTEQDLSKHQAGAPSAARTLLQAALRRARWAILWERLWPALATFATAVGLFLAASWLGLWLWLPPLLRAAALIVIGAAVLAALIPFGLLRIPGAAEGLRRLDRGSGLAHRPATAIADELAVADEDPYALALWNAHVARALTVVRALKAGAPSPRVAWRDPYALRGLILIACIATFIAAGGERWKRVAAAFDWQGVALPANFRVDAWVMPPAYTGKPPLVLPGIHPGETAQAQPAGPFAVPVNSTLIVRSTGRLDLDVTGSGGVTPAKDAVHAPAGTEERRFTIAATGAASLRGAGEEFTWPFNAIPDHPPTIELVKDPQEQNRGSLLLSYRLEDDYGVTQAEASFARKDDAAGAAGAAGTTGAAPHPLFGPPNFALTLPQARVKNGIGQTVKDLTDHPWAGAEVTMTLIAHDEGGNAGTSAPFSFRLPQRVFLKPLARALVEQRRILAMDANSRPLVITALDALALAPEKYTPDAGVYLGLRSIFWELVRAKSDGDLRDVVARLWQMAVGIEDGDIADAQEALRNAENALQQALERGASDAELKALMDQLRAAMDRFMQALAQQLRNNRELARPLDPDARVLSRRDLQNMLDRLENLAKNGAKDAARALLQQLEQMMENLQMASPEMNGEESEDMSELDDLGDMIRQQQVLRDRTFREGQDQRQRDAQGRLGKPGQPRQGGDAMGQLRGNQEALRDRLNKLLEELKNRGFGQNQQGQQGQQGQPAPGQDGLDQLGRAGDAMGEAAGELGNNDTDDAVGSQGRALDALRKGAQGLAQSMQQQMGQGIGPGRAGRLGQSRGQDDTDPLGRPLRGRDYGDDASVKIPGDIDVQRARRIIEELRRRFGDFARPQEELDYIQRLLKDY